jgi:hypothetical protein
MFLDIQCTSATELRKLFWGIYRHVMKRSMQPQRSLRLPGNHHRNNYRRNNNSCWNDERNNLRVSNCCWIVLALILERVFFSFEVGHWVTKCEKRGLKSHHMHFYPKSGCDYVKARTYLVNEKPPSTGSVSAIGSIR